MEITDNLVVRVGEIKKRPHLINDWEKKFIKNIDLQLLQGRELTPKQYFCVEKIWKTITSEKKIPLNVPRVSKAGKRNYTPQNKAPKKTFIRKSLVKARGNSFYSGEAPPWE